jgi:hypothetical protein
MVAHKLLDEVLQRHTARQAEERRAQRSRDLQEGVQLRQEGEAAWLI